MTPGADFVVPVPEFREKILGLDPESPYALPEEEPFDEGDPEAQAQMNVSKS
jgi:hypothetical protein